MENMENKENKAQTTQTQQPTPTQQKVDTSMDPVVIFGGIGSLPGSVTGAVVLTLVPELLRGLMEYRMLIYGGVLVFMMLMRPEGLLGKMNFKHIRQQCSAAADDGKGGS